MEQKNEKIIKRDEPEGKIKTLHNKFSLVFFFFAVTGDGYEGVRGVEVEEKGNKGLTKTRKGGSINLRLNNTFGTNGLTCWVKRLNVSPAPLHGNGGKEKGKME